MQDSVTKNLKIQDELLKIKLSDNIAELTEVQLKNFKKKFFKTFEVSFLLLIIINIFFSPIIL